MLDTIIVLVILLGVLYNISLYLLQIVNEIKDIKNEIKDRKPLPNSEVLTQLNELNDTIIVDNNDNYDKYDMLVKEIDVLKQQLISFTTNDNFITFAFDNIMFEIYDRIFNENKTYTNEVCKYNNRIINENIGNCHDLVKINKTYSDFNICLMFYLKNMEYIIDFYEIQTYFLQFYKKIPNIKQSPHTIYTNAEEAQFLNIGEKKLFGTMSNLIPNYYGGNHCNYRHIITNILSYNEEIPLPIIFTQLPLYDITKYLLQWTHQDKNTETINNIILFTTQIKEYMINQGAHFK